MTCQRCAELERALRDVSHMMHEFRSRFVITAVIDRALAAADDKMGPTSDSRSICEHTPAQHEQMGWTCDSITQETADAISDKVGPGAERARSTPNAVGCIQRSGDVQPSAPASPCPTWVCRNCGRESHIFADHEQHTATCKPDAPCPTCGGKRTVMYAPGEYSSLPARLGSCPDCVGHSKHIAPAPAAPAMSEEAVASILARLACHCIDDDCDVLPSCPKCVECVLAGAKAK